MLISCLALTAPGLAMFPLLGFLLQLLHILRPLPHPFTGLQGLPPPLLVQFLPAAYPTALLPT